MLVISECGNCKCKRPHAPSRLTADAERREYILLRCVCCQATHRLYVKDAGGDTRQGNQEGV
jgi:hypothetical protein